jgi:hypothetical protein
MKFEVTLPVVMKIIHLCGAVPYDLVVTKLSNKSVASIFRLEHGIASQKTIIMIATNVRTSDIFELFYCPSRP